MMQFGSPDQIFSLIESLLDSKGHIVYTQLAEELRVTTDTAQRLLSEYIHRTERRDGDRNLSELGCMLIVGWTEKDKNLEDQNSDYYHAVLDIQSYSTLCGKLFEVQDQLRMLNLKAKHIDSITLMGLFKGMKPDALHLWIEESQFALSQHKKQSPWIPFYVYFTLNGTRSVDCRTLGKPASTSQQPELVHVFGSKEKKQPEVKPETSQLERKPDTNQRVQGKRNIKNKKQTLNSKSDTSPVARSQTVIPSQDARSPSTLSGSENVFPNKESNPFKIKHEKLKTTSVINNDVVSKIENFVYSNNDGSLDKKKKEISTKRKEISSEKKEISTEKVDDSCNLVTEENDIPKQRKRRSYRQVMYSSEDEDMEVEKHKTNNTNTTLFPEDSSTNDYIEDSSSSNVTVSLGKNEKHTSPSPQKDHIVKKGKFWVVESVDDGQRNQKKHTKQTSLFSFINQK